MKSCRLCSRFLLDGADKVAREHAVCPQAKARPTDRKDQGVMTVHAVKVIEVVRPSGARVWVRYILTPKGKRSICDLACAHETEDAARVCTAQQLGTSGTPEGVGP